MKISKQFQTANRIFHETDIDDNGHPWIWRHFMILLLCIENPDGLTNEEIGQQIGMDYRNTSRLVRELVRIYGLLERKRNPGSKTGYLITANSKGRKFLKGLVDS